MSYRAPVSEIAFTLKHVAGLGGALKDQQLIQLKIGRMKMLTEALRSYVLRVAWEHDQHNLTTNAGLVMNLATDYIQEIAELNIGHAIIARAVFVTRLCSFSKALSKVA